MTALGDGIVLPPGLPAAELVRHVAHHLAAAGVATPDVDARWLVADASSHDQLREWVVRRAAREPLQLIVGSTAFRTLELECRHGVFVPRPETEVVAGVAIDAARAAGPAALVVEPCTGAGAIAAALLAEVPGCHVEATDVNPRAVELADRNCRTGAAEGHGATWQVRRGSLLDPVDRAVAGTVDVLVANPPYLPAEDARTWPPEVARHDPPEALIGGVDGNEVVAEIVALANDWLRPGGTLVVEVDSRRADDVRALAHAAGLVDVVVGDDLTGRPRFLRARRGWHAGRP